MTDRRHGGSCSGNSVGGGYGNGASAPGSKRSTSPTRPAAAGRCNIGTAVVRPTPPPSAAAQTADTMMHVKKTWKNAAVMLLAVAVVSTATTAFYFNYTATEASTCCMVGQSSSLSDPADSGEEFARGKFGSSVLQASKLYAVCKVHDHRPRPDGFDRSRRQIVDTTTGGTSYKNSANPYGDRNGDGRNDTTMIYFITPTYPRREQMAELTRLGQTLMHVPRLHWIVADDRPDCSVHLMNLLPDFSIPYTYIASPMPAVYKRKTDAIPRGVSNRRAALNWIRLNHNTNDSNAVIYFGDDDNTFHLDLFKEIRSTKKISMFPVGLVGEYGVSSPIIDKGKVVGFFDSWPAKRKFPVDMAGFAINVSLLFKYPYATMPYKAGFEEDRFLSSLSIRLDEIEPKAENCTKILVWHTQTAKKPKPIVMVRSKATLPGSLATLLDQVTMLGIGEVSETTGVRSYMTKNGNIFRV